MRTVSVYLNVTVPAHDPRTTDEIANDLFFKAIDPYKLGALDLTVESPGAVTATPFGPVAA